MRSTAFVITVVLGSVSACADRTTGDEGFDPDGKSDSGSAPLEFFQETGATKVEIAGRAAAVFPLSDSIEEQLAILGENAAYGCYSGAAARLAPADLKYLLASNARRSMLASAVIMGESVSEAPEDTIIEGIARNQVFSRMYADVAVPGLDWDEDEPPVFKATLRIVIRSLLSSSQAKAWQYTETYYSDDSSWVATDVSTGLVKLVTHNGHCSE